MGTHSPKQSRPARTIANQKLADGLTKHQAILSMVVVDGAQFTAPQAVSELDEIISAADLAVTSHAAWLAAVQADLQKLSSSATFVAGLRQAVMAAFGKQVDVLADFGLKPRKSVVRTPEQKQEAAAKAKATRAARHTMGKRQRAAITGATAAAAAAASSEPPAPTSPSTTPQP
jgi:D-serine deaminase-like pyridoxal phosphate-dependent protein